MSHYKVEAKPLASVKKCDAKAVERYLEEQAKKGLSLVAVTEVTGVPHWIFSVAKPAKQESVDK